MVTEQKKKTPYDVIETSYSDFENCIHQGDQRRKEGEDVHPDWISMAGRNAKTTLKAIIRSRIEYSEAVQSNQEKIEEIEDACLEYLIESPEPETDIDVIASKLYLIMSERLEGGVRLVPKDIEQIARNKIPEIPINRLYKSLARMESLHAQELQYLGYQRHFSLFEI